MHPALLRAIYAWDRLGFAVSRARYRGRLEARGEVSPNLRLARIRIEPGGRLVLGPGVAAERRRGNHLWVHEGSTLEIGAGTWLRTEHGENRLTAYPGASVRVGERSLLNGAMIVSKREVTIGADARLAFGVRILDTDLHDLDRDSPESPEPVRIGDRVWLGADVLVLKGVEIGDDVVVAAGAVVTRDLPPRVLAVGSPARPLREIGSREGCR